MASPKVFFILFDGAEWNVINPLLRAGRLPNLARFMESASYGPLRSLDDTALFSPILWTSMASGKLPYKHGIKDFFDTANAVRCARLWEIFEHDQLPIGLFGYLLTWPPRPTKGFIIPDWCARTPETYPPELSFINTLTESRGDWRQMIATGRKCIKHGMRMGTMLTGLREALRDKLSKRDRLDSYHLQRLIQLYIHADLFVELVRRYQPYFTVFYTGLPDAVHHQYWQYLEPDKFAGVSPDEVARYGGVIPMVYEQLDRVLGRLLQESSPETLVVMASDHGGEANDEEYRWADIHTGNFIRALNLQDSMTAFRVGPRVYFRLRKAETHLGSLEQIADYIRQTVLVSSSAPLLSVEITGPEEMTVKVLYIKSETKGQSLRFPDGRVVPFEQVLQLSARISGNHSLNGIFLMGGPNVKRNHPIEGAGLLDVVPTVLALLGRAVGSDMDGKVLTDAIAPQFLAEHPIQYIDSYDELLGKGVIESSEDEEIGLDIVKKRLEDLGYIDE